MCGIFLKKKLDKGGDLYNNSKWRCLLAAGIRFVFSFTAYCCYRKKCYKETNLKEKGTFNN